MGSSERRHITAYTTGFSLEGHSIAISEEAFKTLFQVVLREKEGGCSMNVHIPGRIHPFLIEWALKQGLRLVRLSIYHKNYPFFSVMQN